MLEIRNRIVLWDNDGTVSNRKSPKEAGSGILPNIHDAMSQAKQNFIVSGYKSAESEAQNYNPETVSQYFKYLMRTLPIEATVFSPFIGGTGCFLIHKEAQDQFSVVKAHEDPQYKDYVGRFKEPDIGMFVVLATFIKTRYGDILTKDNSLMIGDTIHDQAAAENFGIPFLQAKIVHEGGFV